MTVDAIYGETVPNLVSQGLVVRQDGYIRLTNKGKFPWQRSFSTFLTAAHENAW